jgi:tetratricopeptide (TPR) repeat protein
MAQPKTKTTVIEDYRAAVAANPKSVEAQTNLGWGIYSQSDYPAAVEQFRVAIDVNANFVDAQYGLALANKRSGHTSEAIAAFEIALSLLTTIDDPNRSRLMGKIIRSHLRDIRA